jgi:carbamoylphosphate synthase small subunit
MKKAWLILEDGTKFEGRGFGADGEAAGEVVFTTSMTGFQEILSDPNHKFQIVVSTFATVGAPGANDEDCVSGDSPAGFVVREYCDAPSNFRAGESIDAFMKKRGVVGICGVDTRELTRLLRAKGSMNGVISLNENAAAAKLPQIDFCEQYSAEIADMEKRVQMNERIFATENEHLFLAAAMGGKIIKMNVGHRGSSQPVKDLRNGNVYSTRQNHGYVVESIPADVGEVVLENVNDRSIEGIVYKKIPAMSVAFAPSEHGGPRNTNYLRQEFLKLK